MKIDVMNKDLTFTHEIGRKKKNGLYNVWIYEKGKRGAYTNWVFQNVEKAKLIDVQGMGTLVLADYLQNYYTPIANAGRDEDPDYREPVLINIETNPAKFEMDIDELKLLMDYIGRAPWMYPNFGFNLVKYENYFQGDRTYYRNRVYEVTFEEENPQWKTKNQLINYIKKVNKENKAWEGYR